MSQTHIPGKLISPEQVDQIATRFGHWVFSQSHLI
jgi:hypothetical protein